MSFFGQEVLAEIKLYLSIYQPNANKKWMKDDIKSRRMLKGRIRDSNLCILKNFVVDILVLCSRMTAIFDLFVNKPIREGDKLQSSK